MEKINKLVKSNQPGSRLQVTVEQGVNYLIECPYDVKSVTYDPTPISISDTSWYIQLENGNYVYFYFKNKNVYNTLDHVCIVTITEKFVHDEMGGTHTQYDSLSFLDDLVQNIKSETGLVLQYDCFGNKK